MLKMQQMMTEEVNMRTIEKIPALRSKGRNKPDEEVPTDRKTTIIPGASSFWGGYSYNGRHFQGGEKC